MSEIFINKARSVAITGHRILNKDFNQIRLEKQLEELIKNGYDTFLIGMALGFDSTCFKALEKIRERKQIKLVACIPCLSQDYKFNDAQKKEYRRMLSVADEKVLISKEYTNRCMQKRNKFMVDNASVVLAYIKRDLGGTANTVKYAKQNGVPVIVLD